MWWGCSLPIKLFHKDIIMERLKYCVIGGLAGFVFSLPGPIDIGLSWWLCLPITLVGVFAGIFLYKHRDDPPSLF